MARSQVPNARELSSRSSPRLQEDAIDWILWRAQIAQLIPTSTGGYATLAHSRRSNRGATTASTFRCRRMCVRRSLKMQPRLGACLCLTDCSPQRVESREHAHLVLRHRGQHLPFSQREQFSATGRRASFRPRSHLLTESFAHFSMDAKTDGLTPRSRTLCIIAGAKCARFPGDEGRAQAGCGYIATSAPTRHGFPLDSVWPRFRFRREILGVFHFTLRPVFIVPRSGAIKLAA